MKSEGILKRSLVSGACIRFGLSKETARGHKTRACFGIQSFLNHVCFDTLELY